MRKIFVPVLLCMSIIMLCACRGQGSFTTEYITKEFAKTDELLRNPGKGLVVQGPCDPSYDEAYYNMCSVAYERFEWAALEPSEGAYNWALIDSYIEEATKRGLKFAFGVMNVNTSSENLYVTPKWVFDAGAEGKVFTTKDTYARDHETICPNWSDPVFIEKVTNFVFALGERYNGNKNIAYIDIRSYGNWGEQHLYGLEDARYPLIPSKNLKEDYIIPYKKAFPDTLLVNACNGELYKDVYEWAVNEGMALRRDGIMGFSDGSECLMAYGKVPAIYEFGNSVENYLKTDSWNMDEVEEDIEIGKPSYLEFTYDAYKESAEEFGRFANKIGYYFRLKSAKVPKMVKKNSEINIDMTFVNDGVAYLYEDAIIKIGLFDSDGNPVKIAISGTAPGKWEPGKEYYLAETFDVDGIEKEEYSVAVGFFADEEDDLPDYLLGNEGNTGSGWYALGEINVQ